MAIVAANQIGSCQPAARPPPRSGPEQWRPRSRPVSLTSPCVTAVCYDGFVETYQNTKQKKYTNKLLQLKLMKLEDYCLRVWRTFIVICILSVYTQSDTECSHDGWMCRIGSRYIPWWFSKGRGPFPRNSFPRRSILRYVVKLTCVFWRYLPL